MAIQPLLDASQIPLTSSTTQDGPRCTRDCLVYHRSRVTDTQATADDSRFLVRRCCLDILEFALPRVERFDKVGDDGRLQRLQPCVGPMCDDVEASVESTFEGKDDVVELSSLTRSVYSVRGIVCFVDSQR